MSQEQYEKELALKDEEYNILRVTSEQIEDEQRKEIYELQRKINKAIEYIKTTTTKNEELNCTKLLAVNQVIKLLEILEDEEEEDEKEEEEK